MERFRSITGPHDRVHQAARGRKLLPPHPSGTYKKGVPDAIFVKIPVVEYRNIAKWRPTIPNNRFFLPSEFL